MQFIAWLANFVDMISDERLLTEMFNLKRPRRLEFTNGKFGCTDWNAAAYELILELNKIKPSFFRHEFFFTWQTESTTDQ